MKNTILSAAISELERLTLTKKDEALSLLNEVVSNLPTPFIEMIEAQFKFKRVPKEYSVASILFTLSSSIGTTFYLDVMGYKNYSNLYFAIIGSRGDAKSESIKCAVKPLKISDDLSYEDFLYDSKQQTDLDHNKPIRKQILIQNASIEAAQKAHFDNPNSIGICIDEIFGLIEKMGNPNSRDGNAWRNFFLEGYTNGHLDILRKTTESFRLSETCPTLIGGLQHQFIPKLFANGNLESGFIDRLLFTPKLTSNNKIFKGCVENKVISDYEKCIEKVLAYKKQSEKPDEDIKQFEVNISSFAEERIRMYTQELINRQECAPEVLTEYLSKMQISIHKFCLLCFIMNNIEDTTFNTSLTSKEVDQAIVLNEFYYLNFQMIIEENLESKERMISLPDVIRIAKKNNSSQKAVAEVTGVNKSTVSKNWNRI